MRTSLRVFAAATCSLVAAAFLTTIPFATPAHAVAGINKVTIGSASVGEGGILDFPISLNFPALGSVSVTVKTQDISASSSSTPADYTAIGNTSFTWSLGQGDVKHLLVHTIQDTTPEPDEQLAVAFTELPQGADPTAASGLGTIQDDDHAVNSVPKLTVSGGGNAAEGNADNVRDITVTLDKTYDQAVTVNYATADGTATSDNTKGTPDFTPITTQTLTFPAGVNPPAPQVIHVTVKGDNIGEPNEGFILGFGGNNNAAFNGTPNQTIGLVNDDGQAPQISVADIAPISEGDSGTKTLQVTLNVSPAPAQPISVQVDTADGTAVATTQDAAGDYLPVVKQVVTMNGASKTVDITINGDRAQEPDETFHVNLSAPNNATLGAASKDATIQNDDFGQITTGVGPGGGPHVKTFGSEGAELGGFLAFGGNFAGGVHVARGDIFKGDGTPGADGVDEIIVGTGRINSNNSHSLPLVNVYSITGVQLASFLAYDSGFGGGVYVAAGNLDGNPSNGDEIVTGAGSGGGPHVKVFHINQGGQNTSAIDVSNGGFFAYDGGFHGGVRVAVANEGGDARDEIVTGAGPGGGPHVRIFGLNNANAYAPVGGFFAYDPGFGGGVFVAASAGKIVTGAGAGGGPHVRVFNGDGTPQGGGFFAYDPGFHGGVSVAMGNLDNDPAAEIVTSPGAGGGPHVRAFKQDGSMPFGGGFFAYTNWGGGVEVSIGGGGA